MQRSETPPDRRPENEARMTGGQLLTTQHMKFGDLILIFRIFADNLAAWPFFYFRDTQGKKIETNTEPI